MLEEEFSNKRAVVTFVEGDEEIVREKLIGMRFPLMLSLFSQDVSYVPFFYDYDLDSAIVFKDRNIAELLLVALNSIRDFLIEQKLKASSESMPTP